ncbi:unnamed protein product [Allacma fusca]|uniref:Kazal-like domain-containing protein n=1 Tax=Allacma fusca TaxID=39272 RepID=A0A8J2LNN2_9HEXA|nr:unnamed protein product [Allacma fusca]
MKTITGFITLCLLVSSIDCNLRYQWLYNRPPMYLNQPPPDLLESQVRPSGRNCVSTCPCPYNVSPVCANNGKTYSNQCSFECERRQCQPYLRLLRSGYCSSDNSFAVEY